MNEKVVMKKDIDELRKELLKLADKEDDFAVERLLEISEELDILINRYEEIVGGGN